MSPLGWFLLLALAGLFGIGGFVALAYNRLVALRNRVSNALSQIDVQLKRRHDLIPNLVETAKGYLAHERQTLEAVIKARSDAVSALGVIEGSAAGGLAAGALAGGVIAQVAGAEAHLGSALGTFLGRLEAYPELKADGVMRRLMEELTTTENRIAFARQAYNDSAMTYRTQRQSFPTVLVAGPLGFADVSLWDLEPASPAREAVAVRL